MRRGAAGLLVVVAMLGLAPSALATIGTHAVNVSRDHQNNVTVVVDKPVSACVHPKSGAIRVFCFAMTNNEFLMFGPSGVIWTPAHTEDFYDNVTGNHFTGQDPGTLDIPL